MNGETFYFYWSGSFHRSVDGAANFTRTASLPDPGRAGEDADRTAVKAAPGLEGEVWVNLEENGLYRSSDGGNTFVKLRSVQQATLFVFGKNPPGKAHPGVFVLGRVGNEQGVFRSDDMGASWLKVSAPYPALGDTPQAMEGDRQMFGRVYIGANGRGVYFGEPASENAGGADVPLDVLVTGTKR